MRNKTHREEDDEEVKPDCKIGKPAELLESSNLAKEEAGKGPNETADGVTELKLRGFRESFAIGDDDDGNVANQLDGLQNIHAIACPISVEAKCNVTIGSKWVFV